MDLNLERAKDVLLFSGCAALYGLQAQLAPNLTKKMVAVVAVSRLANLILLECVRKSCQDVPIEVGDEDFDYGGRYRSPKEYALKSRYSFTNGLVNMTTILALSAFGIIGLRGGALIGALSGVNFTFIHKPQTSSLYRSLLRE